MDFTTAIKTCLNKYATFAGRASRSEFWYYTLFLFLLAMTASFLDLAMSGDANGFFYGLVVLLSILPTISVNVRRLHDVGRSGWWWWLSLIPIIGGLVLLFWYASKGTSGANRFGPDPLAAA